MNHYTKLPDYTVCFFTTSIKLFITRFDFIIVFIENFNFFLAQSMRRLKKVNLNLQHYTLEVLGLFPAGLFPAGPFPLIFPRLVFSSLGLILARSFPLLLFPRRYFFRPFFSNKEINQTKANQAKPNLT